MQNMEQDPIQKLIQDAAEPLAPTEAAKDRMYAEIMRRAAEKQASRHQKRRPWYQRWQTSAGAVALACVVLAFSALHGRLPQNGAGQLEVVPEQTTVTEAVGIMETETKTQPQESAASVPQKETTAVSETAAVSKETQTTAASAVTEVPSLPAQLCGFVSCKRNENPSSEYHKKNLYARRYEFVLAYRFFVFKVIRGSSSLRGLRPRTPRCPRHILPGKIPPAFPLHHHFPVWPPDEASGALRLRLRLRQCR